MKTNLTRRLLALLLAMIVAVGAIPLTVIPASAAVAADGLVYEIIDGEITITGYNGSESKLYIPASIRGCPVTKIGYSAFSGCGVITEVTIPEGVTLIDADAFYYCTNLKSITLPDSLTYIGMSAFYSCEKLEGINIPSGVTTIGAGAFGGCISLASLTADSDNTVYYAEGNCIITRADKSVVAGCALSEIPEGVISIGSSAFRYCRNLTNITIPDSVKEIGSYAFGNCSNLVSIIFPEELESIGTYAFHNCISLADISIPKGVEEIESYAFYGCDSLENVTLPEGVKDIREYAFYNCKKLKSISIPEDVISISDYAFYYCEKLSTVYYGGTEEQWDKISIGSGNTYLTKAKRLYSGETEDPAERMGISYEIADGKVTVTGYTGILTELVIPATIEGYPVTAIGDWAFELCRNLKSVQVKK